MEEAEIIDIWRQQHPYERKFTWHRTKPPVFCTLDMILASFEMVGFIEKSDILPSFKSDHSVVTLDIYLHKEERGRGFWKMNTNHLRDQDCVNLINDCITEPEINLTIAEWGFLTPQEFNM